MKILALDSSAQVATVALTEDERLLAEYTIHNGNTHSETLLPMVESLMKLYGIRQDEIDLFAVSAGPGSFTGVRIGVATVKGLAFGTDKPCLGVSTLEAIAENLSISRGLICPVMNARRSQVYTALFRSNGKTLTRLCPDMAISLSDLDDMLASYGEEVFLAGDGYEISKEALVKTVTRYTPERLRHQSAYSVACVAWHRYQNGDRTTDMEIKVSYLRPSQAERERLEAEEKKKTQ